MKGSMGREMSCLNPLCEDEGYEWVAWAGKCHALTHCVKMKGSMGREMSCLNPLCEDEG